MNQATQLTITNPLPSDEASTIPMRRVRRAAPAPAPRTGPRLVPVMIRDEVDEPPPSDLAERLRAAKLAPREQRALFALARSFAWSDLELCPREIELLLALGEALGVGPAATSDALAGPPEPEEIDPARLPRGCPELVLDVALATMSAQRPIDAEATARFRLLEELVLAREACTI